MVFHTPKLIAIAVILTILAYFSTTEFSSNLDESDANFVVSDSLLVTKMSINQSLNFTKKINQWYVNDTTLVDLEQFSTLSTWAMNLKVKRGANEQEGYYFEQNAPNSAIKVAFFDESAAIIKEFILLGDTLNAAVLYGKMDDNEDVFVIDIGSSTLDLQQLAATDALFWKNKLVFSSSRRSIERISVKFAKTPNDNFEIEAAPNFPKVVAMAATDSVKMMSYVELFKNVKIKRYFSAAEAYKRDSLLNISPSFEIEVKDKLDSRSNKISIFYQSKQNSEIYALLGRDKLGVVIRPLFFEYILQKRSFFEKK